jgi:hypothetical protein
MVLGLNKKITVVFWIVHRQSIITAASLVESTVDIRVESKHYSALGTYICACMTKLVDVVWMLRDLE